MDNYIVVFGGCGWDATYKQLEDGTYPNIPDPELPGSKGANQAVATARAGYPTKIISVVGADTIGAKIINNLTNNDVNVDCVKVLEGVKSDSCSIYVSLNGDNDIHRVKDAINHFTPDMVDEFAEILENSQAIITQSKLPKEVYSKLIEFGAKTNVSTVLTPCPAKGLEINNQENLELLQKVTHITANLEEALQITGSQSAEEAIKLLPNMIVTCGVNGVYFSENGKICHVPAILTENVIDTTGAGDTFCGNFVASLLMGYSKEDSIKIGVMASTVSIGAMGAQTGMPYKTWELFDAEN